MLSLGFFLARALFERGGRELIPKGQGSVSESLQINQGCFVMVQGFGRSKSTLARTGVV